MTTEEEDQFEVQFGNPEPLVRTRRRSKYIPRLRAVENHNRSFPREWGLIQPGITSRDSAYSRKYWFTQRWGEQFEFRMAHDSEHEGRWAIWARVLEGADLEEQT
jgi:hypothetical protein